jgi:ribosomal protein S6--L-glutamate ligase
MLTEKLSASRGVIEALRGLYAQFVVQEFIAEAKGADLRCFVVGDRVVAAMKRQAPKGDFRSNLHRGGQAKGVKPTALEQETAIRAAQSLGLGVAGVDLIRSARGPLVLEVNASPGLEGIEEASGVDVAGAVVEYVSQSVATAKRALPKKASKSPLVASLASFDEDRAKSSRGARKRGLAAGRS